MEKRNIIECGRTPSLSDSDNRAKTASEKVEELDSNILKAASERVTKGGCANEQCKRKPGFA